MAKAPVDQANCTPPCRRDPQAAAGAADSRPTRGRPRWPATLCALLCLALWPAAGGANNGRVEPPEASDAQTCEMDPAARIPFPAFAERLQHDVCQRLYGDLHAGQGLACMHDDVMATYRPDPDSHEADVALCDAQGGVLLGRIPACTDAMVRYLCATGHYADEDAMYQLLESYAAVSSHCWGAWLCLEG